MPIYEYQCTRCGVQFEVSQGINDARLGTCTENVHEPVAGEEPLKCEGTLQRVFMNSGATFQLKGRGWTGNNLTKKGN